MHMHKCKWKTEQGRKETRIAGELQIILSKWTYKLNTVHLLLFIYIIYKK